MIQVTFKVKPEQLNAVIEALEATGMAEAILSESEQDLQLKPMTDLDFYKKINHANKAIQDKKLVSQELLEKEAEEW